MSKYFVFFAIFLHSVQGVPISLNVTNPLESFVSKQHEGDLLLRNKEFVGKSVITYEWAKWPDGIVYYELDKSFSGDDVELIESAMQDFHRLTCVKWKKRENDEENFVEIENTAGCWAEGGMQGGPQAIALESPRCMKKGVIIHELMHTLGFLHEVSRPDRDDFVTVNYGNIIAGMEENFVKMTPLQLDTLGFRYDYKSVMHYKAWAFAEDKSQPTITPTDGDVKLSDLGLGQEIGELSETDVLKIKKFYNCPE